MAKIQIRKDSKIRLPEAACTKIKDREKVVDSKHVKSLIGSRLLLTKDLNKLLNEAISKTTEINVMIDEMGIPFSSFPHNLRELGPSIIAQARKKYPKKDIGDIPPTQFTAILKQAEKELETKKSQETREKIAKTSSEMEDLLDGFKSEYKDSEISILNKKTLYFCKNCSNLYTIDEFRSGECKCKIVLKSSSNTSKDSTTIVDNNVMKFVQQNMWLEHGVEILFSETGFNTVCGVNVLGNSGVWHEIDILAEKNKERIRTMVECKTGPINLSILFNVYSKMNDLGLNKAYVFSTALTDSIMVSRFAQAKNIVIFEQILEQDKNIVKNNLL